MGHFIKLQKILNSITNSNQINWINTDIKWMFQITDRQQLSLLASQLLVAAFHLLLSKLVLSAQEESEDKDQIFHLAENSNYTKHKIWIKTQTKSTNSISKIMIKICLITKMIHLEFLRTKTEKKWKICKFLEVIFPLEKERRQPAREAKTLRNLEQSRQISWALQFKNRESFIIKNNRSFKIDLKSRFQRTSQKMKSQIASNKERRTWRQVQRRRKLVPSFLRLV